MSEPLAFLLTWPTYGSWLHGDERGSVDREHNVFGSPTLKPNLRRAAHEARLRKHSPLILADPARRVVHQAITDHCRYRVWDLHALSVRTNHVHVVVGYAGLPPERMLSQFKAWGTRRLREAGCVAWDVSVWVKHGSTRYLWCAQNVADAVDYVELAQDLPR